MKKTERMAFVAAGAFYAGVMLFMFGGYSEELSLNVAEFSVNVFAKAAMVCLIVANLATAATLWLKQNHSKFIWDDVSFTATCVLAFGVILGMVGLLIETCISMNKIMLAAMWFPTIGIIFLALVVLGIFFAGHALRAVILKDYWTALKGAGITGVVLATAFAALCGSEFLPIEWLSVCVYIAIACIAITLIAIRAPQYLERTSSN